MPSNPTFREEMLSWFFNIGNPTRPTTFFISFHVGDPGTTGANESATLARVQSDNWDDFGSPGDGVIGNTDAGTSLGAVGGPETITFFGIWSAASAGQYYVSGPLANSRVVQNGEKLTWTPGDLLSTMG